MRDGAQIGKKCVLGQNVYVGEKVRIGSGCRIQNNVSVYDGVELEDDVFVGPSVVFSNVKRPRAHITQRDQFASTKIGKGVTLGANATIVCGVTIGEYAFIAAGAVVSKSVPAFAMVMGVPAKIAGYVCRCGDDLKPETNCEQCNMDFKDISK